MYLNESPALSNKPASKSLFKMEFLSTRMLEDCRGAGDSILKGLFLCNLSGVYMAKRYWLKTSEHFFKDSHMVYLKSQKNGYEYIYLWQSLLLKCLEVDDESDCGFLRLNDKIPYSPELLSDIFGMNIDVVKAGVDIFVNLGMMSILENGTLYIESVQKMIGRESESAERVRRHREKKALHCNNGVTKSNPILVLDTITNKEEEKEKKPKKEKFSPPSLDILKQYFTTNNITEFTPESFYNFYDSKGWMIGKNKMKSWTSAIGTWKHRCKQEAVQEKQWFPTGNKNGSGLWEYKDAKGNVKYE